MGEARTSTTAWLTNQVFLLTLPQPLDAAFDASVLSFLLGQFCASDQSIADFPIAYQEGPLINSIREKVADLVKV